MVEQFPLKELVGGSNPLGLTVAGVDGLLSSISSKYWVNCMFP
jgi:hypothetical protein